MTPEVVAHRLMLDFAERTGLTGSARPPVRYLWTDAFAVCNFLGRFVEQLDEESLRLALRLVEQTHHVLGRHRADDPREGWLSGLPEAEGALHPTCGGLRIGKKWPERAPEDPEDPATEWDRDGQYFHYLTRWMHALDRVAHVTRDVVFLRQARELARAAYAGFVHTTASGQHVLFWKMSIDLSRPQVASMGLHDALDGFLTFSQLQASSRRLAPSGDGAGPDLEGEIRELARLCSGRRWDTDDALGVGGLLGDAHRLARLMADGALDEPALLQDLLASSWRGVATLVRRRAFEGAPERRLAFRELGLSIGLHAARRLRRMPADTLDRDARETLRELERADGLVRRIESTWLDPRAQACASWRDHLDINSVMLATSLTPNGYLGVAGPAGSHAESRAEPPPGAPG